MPYKHKEDKAAQMRRWRKRQKELREEMERRLREYKKRVKELEQAKGKKD